MCFKDLNKKNKFSFLFFLICASIELLLGIIFKEIFVIAFSFLIFAECLSVCNEQLSDNIIKNYEDMLEIAFTSHEETLRMISQTLKKGDAKSTKELIKILDDRLEKEKKV